MEVISKIAANADSWFDARSRRDLLSVATGRVSLTSALVCVGILVWALTNAYLGQA